MPNRLVGWWGRRIRGDKWLFIILAIAAVLITTITSIGLFTAQSRERARTFQEYSDTVFDRIALTVNTWVAQGESGRDLIQLSDGMSGENYWVFSQHLIETDPVLKAVDLMPRVLDANRAGFEAERSLEFGYEYTIREFNAEGDLVTAGQRPEYYPASDGRLRGWDIATDPNIGPILDSSRTHHNPAGVVIPSPLDENEFRIVIAYPVFDSKEIETENVPDPDSVIAFTLLVMGITDLVNQATFDTRDFVAVEVESDVGGQSKILYSQSFNDTSSPSISQSIEILGTEWIVTTTQLAGVPGRWPNQFPVIITITLFFVSMIVALAVATIISQRGNALVQAGELRELSESKTRFLSTVSHELKTPLTSVTAFTDLVLRNTDSNLTERQVGHLEIVRRNSQRLNVLIDDLLDVSRIDAGRLRIQAINFDVRPVLQNLLDGLAPVFDEKSQPLHSEISDKPLWIEGDQDRIEQVISNLLINASKYSPAGSEVFFRAAAIDDGVVISIQDHGIGISSEDAGRIFEPFFRADNSGTSQESGTGLGLFITKSIVEMHNGEIKIESIPDSGTVVTVTIPGVIVEFA
jgi:signal transduction histidine kinase